MPASHWLRQPSRVNPREGSRRERTAQPGLLTHPSERRSRRTGGRAAASLHVASVAVTVGESPPAPGAVVVSSTKQLEPFSLTASAVGGVPGTLPASSAGFALTLSEGPTVPVGPGSRVSAPGALATVAKVLGSGATSLTGTIALVHPRRYTTVVTAAVVADAAGQLCVFTVSSGRLRPILVRTHGGPPGEVAVTGLPASVQDVVANPAQVARGRSC